jgi:hypothetical protein
MLSEFYKTTDPTQWPIWFDPTESMKEIQKVLASYKVPVYHMMIDVLYDRGYLPENRNTLTEYVDSRYIYIWTFSNDKQPVIHIYYQGGDLDTDLTCVYEKTMECKEIKGVADEEEYQAIYDRMMEIQGIVSQD